MPESALEQLQQQGVFGGAAPLTFRLIYKTSDGHEKVTHCGVRSVYRHAHHHSPNYFYHHIHHRDR